MLRQNPKDSNLRAKQYFVEKKKVRKCEVVLDHASVIISWYIFSWEEKTNPKRQISTFAETKKRSF